MTALFRFLPPGPGLSGLIRQHQIIRLRFAAGERSPVKPYWPRPAAALAFYVRDAEHVWGADVAVVQEKPRAVLIGQPTKMTFRQGGGNFSVYQIEFEPGALYRLTGIPLSRLTDTHIDAEAFFPRDFRDLICRIEDLDDPEAAVPLAEAYLSALWRKRAATYVGADRMASAMIRRPDLNLDRAAFTIGRTTRQMRRDFADRVGISPKAFARVARFDRLVRISNCFPDQDWLTSALEAGYYDAHHLRRDFREFADLSPTAFQRLENAAPERRFGFRET